MRHSECTRTSTGSAPPAAVTSPTTSATCSVPALSRYPCAVNSPARVGNRVEAARFSTGRDGTAAAAASPPRWATRSSIVTIARPCSSANARHDVARRIEPSSSTSSTITPTGAQPASRARSTAASVWPGRTSTPPRRERSGAT